MRHAVRFRVGVVKTCLIGAGGVRGVTESHAGCGVCALRARREAAERGTTEAEGKYPFQLDSKEPQWDKFQDYLKGEVLNRKGTIVSFRFCSKTVPERGRRALLSRKGTIISYLATLERYFRRRSGERSVALQVLPENARHCMVIRK